MILLISGGKRRLTGVGERGGPGKHAEGEADEARPRPGNVRLAALPITVIVSLLSGPTKRDRRMKICPPAP